MKKLVFAAIAALVMVSVSNVFANNGMASTAIVAPEDTTTTEATVSAPAEESTTTEEPAPATDNTVANDSVK